jgi:diguanylate cyclase (GGDEF)-like protein
MSIQRDITERKRAAEHIQHQATHDALTDLPNRVLYEQRLKEALAVAREKGHLVGVLFFDLDRFKQINDTLGHPSGDKLLQQVAGRLKERLGLRDTVARMGGDEFTILLPDISDPAQGEEAAQKLLDSLDAPFLIDGQELFITASIGISVAPRDGSDITTLLKNADTAMYRAKDHGRDNFRVYTRNMNETTRDRIELETHLRRALEREELFLLYQPQVSLATGLVYGVETLVRWESPALGRVSPGQFIPLAEETGLIVEIGEFILRESCKQAARWVKAGRPLRVAVNLAARQFDQPNLCDLIQSILKETKLPPEWLDIEMTERMLVQGAQTSDALNRLKALGVRLSVDDFGTGYSSLSYLRTFPLDILKVDQSFVSGLNSDDRRSEAVVRALIELGHAVNLEVIAEGVETEHQKETLVRLGCDAMQGYLFSPATRAEEVDRLADAAAAAAATLEAERGGGTPHLRLVSGG